MKTVSYELHVIGTFSPRFRASEPIWANLGQVLAVSPETMQHTGAVKDTVSSAAPCPLTLTVQTHPHTPTCITQTCKCPSKATHTHNNLSCIFVLYK